MTLEFIGVGNAFAKRHHQNNLLINGNILIDCGASAGRSLDETGRSFEDIEHIFLTHTHADHIGGMEECAFMNKFAYGGRKLRLHLPPELVGPLWEQSLRGGLEDVENGSTALDDYFEVTETPMHFEIEGVRFEIVPTFHVPGKFCCGLKIDERILFSGDTQFMPDMVQRYGADAEVIYHDCQFFTGGIHTSLDELCTLPPDLRHKTCLMHYADDYAGHERQAREAGFRWAEQHRVSTFE